MKKRFISLFLTFMMLLMLVTPTTILGAEENLMPDGTFDNPSEKWGLYTESGGSAEISISKGVLTAEISAAGSKGHSVQVYCDGFEMIQGVQYRLSFDIESSIDRSFEWRIQLNGGDYHAYTGNPSDSMKKGKNSFSYDFTMEETSDPSPRFALNVGDEGGKQKLGKHSLVIDNVILTVLDDSNAVVEEEEEKGPVIALNQVGYLKKQTKTAAITGAESGTKFDVIKVKDQSVAYSGTAKTVKEGGSSEEKTILADFSKLTKKGTYMIRTEDGIESPAFKISDSVYDSLLTDAVRMFYLQRCGMELSKDTAEDFAHDACHTEKAKIYGTTSKIDVSGGWHDAGDYGRYTVAGAKAAADLMLAWENSPDLFTDDTGIAESDNGIPDILDEVRYELDWLLKMQTEDGGVYHKVTGLNFDDVIMPQDSKEALYVFDVSPCATADFAATMYMAARVYQDVDADFAETAEKAADAALDYYTKHADNPGFTNPSNCDTGEYPDTDSTDEYFWAICEGYKSTGSNTLAKQIEDFDLSAFTDTALGWQNVAEYGLYAYLTAGEKLAGYDTCKELFLKKADVLSKTSKQDSFGSSIAEDYPWGSNMTIANNGVYLALAFEIGEKEAYQKAASRQLDYLLGKNVTGYCFVTGYGSLSPKHTHHRPSQTLGITMPGMLVGGPNSALEDPYAQQVLKDTPKAACYVDSEQSYSTNEITIYWNSPLVFLLSAMTSA